jgi:hypothetical protein
MNADCTRYIDGCHGYGERADEAIEDCWIAVERERDPCPSSVVVLDPSWESLAMLQLHSGSSREKLGSVQLPRNVA